MHYTTAEDKTGCSSLFRQQAKPGLAIAGLHLAHHAGILKLLHHAWPKRLTILAYHRIIDKNDPSFRGLVANVSATPENFEMQIDLLRKHFNIISLDVLLAWISGRGDLPAYPALVTFDDGYHDVFDHALPVLRRRCVPAVLFLATDCVGSSRPFFWDLAAHCFRVSQATRADLPLIGRWEWPDEAARRRALHAWLTAAKKCSADQIGRIGADLVKALGVELPPGAFERQHLSWNQIRELQRSGIAIGAHTQSHAILSRLTPEQAREEVVGSKRRIEAELGKAVTAFAYPNGLAGDYRPSDVEMLRCEGFSAAFTLADGPSHPHVVQRDPLQIRRVLVMGEDDIASFTAKIVGATRFLRNIRRVCGSVRHAFGAA